MAVVVGACVFILVIVTLVLLPSNSYAIEIEVRDSEGRIIGSQLETPRENIFEPGSWSIPILTFNICYFSLLLLYYKGPARWILDKYLCIIRNFDISKTITIVLLAIVLFVFLLLTIPDLFVEETSPDYVTYLKPAVENWAWLQQDFKLFVDFKLFLASASLTIFGNVKVIFFLASILLLLLTFEFTRNITGKRIAGIVAMAVLIQSTIFLNHSTLATYDNVWFLLYFISLYIVQRKWHLSPIAYVASTLSKPLSAVFIPMTILFVHQSELSRNRKIILVVVYSSLLVLMLSLILSKTITPISISLSSFWNGLNQLPIILRLDGPIYLAAMMPLMVSLTIMARKGIMHSTSMLFLLLNMLSLPFMYMILVNIPHESHNSIPLIVFFSVAVGTLLSKYSIENRNNRRLLSNVISVVAIAATSIALLSAIFPLLLPSISSFS